jgi:hypothetical protein
LSDAAQCASSRALLATGLRTLARTSGTPVLCACVRDASNTMALIKAIAKKNSCRPFMSNFAIGTRLSRRPHR